MIFDSETGNHFLLFTRFPIARELYGKLPIQMTDEIFLAPTPYQAVARGAPVGSTSELHAGLGAWVYPGHGIGMGCCHACLKIDAYVSREQALHYAWVMVAALYLSKPLDMHIGGFFDYGTPSVGLLGRMPTRIDHRSNICLDTFFLTLTIGLYCNMRNRILRERLVIFLLYSIF